MVKLNNSFSYHCVNLMFFDSLSLFTILFLSQFFLTEIVWLSLVFILWLIFDFCEYKKFYKLEKSQKGKK